MKYIVVNILMLWCGLYGVQRVRLLNMTSYAVKVRLSVCHPEHFGLECGGINVVIRSGKVLTLDFAQALSEGIGCPRSAVLSPQFLRLAMVQVTDVIDRSKTAIEVLSEPLFKSLPDEVLVCVVSNGYKFGIQIAPPKTID